MFNIFMFVPVWLMAARYQLGTRASSTVSALPRSPSPFRLTRTSWLIRAKVRATRQCLLLRRAAVNPASFQTAFLGEARIKISPQLTSWRQFSARPTQVRSRPPSQNPDRSDHPVTTAPGRGDMGHFAALQ